jgi:hypothetical protein
VLLSDYGLIHRPSSAAWSRVGGSRKEQSAEIRSLAVDLRAHGRINRHPLRCLAGLGKWANSIERTTRPNVGTYSWATSSSGAHHIHPTSSHLRCCTSGSRSSARPAKPLSILSHSRHSLRLRPLGKCHRICQHTGQPARVCVRGMFADCGGNPDNVVDNDR